jgi:hypothetical protein
MVALCLLGGLGLAYLREHREQKVGLIRQSSSGDGSPNVQGVQGDVTITVDQSGAKQSTDTNKAPKKNTE